MTARGKARKRALDVLYAAELRDVSPLTTLQEHSLAEGADKGSPARAVPTNHPYTTTLVEGVHAHQVRIDELLSQYSSGWALDRMPVVDRNILRIAVYELLWNSQVPAAVVIDEAVELAKRLSTDESPGFINGLLSQILALRPQQAL